jgi:hypothetical protein
MNTKDSREEREPAGTAPSGVRCPRCNSPMEIHQPDPELVDRFLATCDECSLWLVRNSKDDVLILPPDGSDEDDECDLES